MSEKNKIQEPVIVTTDTVVCDGGDGHLGHPIEFLHINHITNDVYCPYCEKHFVFQAD